MFELRLLGGQACQSPSGANWSVVDVSNGEGIRGQSDGARGITDGVVECDVSVEVRIGSESPRPGEVSRGVIDGSDGAVGSAEVGN